MTESEERVPALDPQQIIEQADYEPPDEDPTDPEVTEDDEINFVFPANLEEISDEDLVNAEPVSTPPQARGAVLTGGYVGARRCTGNATTGCRNLVSWYLGVYGSRGGRNLGIYNCRTVRGGSTTSLHGEGRAADLGCPSSNNWSWDLAEKLRLFSRELGIQCIIHNRRIWSSSGGIGWRYYGGVAAHYDHLHVELTWAAANGGLSIPLLEKYVNGGGNPAPPPPPPPAPGGGGSSDNLPTLRYGQRGEAVASLQRFMTSRFPAYNRYRPTGYYGTLTTAGVKEFQRRTGVTGSDANGRIVGPRTKHQLWHHGWRG